MGVRPAIFLDKDGTLIHDVPYNVDPSLIRLSEHTIEGLRLFQESGFALIVISNQSGVARGLFPVEALEGVERRLRELLLAEGICLDDFIFCPHHPEGVVPAYTCDCACRKPKPGMILLAARRHKIDLSRSWMIGDILDDAEAGKRSGCQSVVISNGNEDQWIPGPYREPDLIVPSLNEAARIIIEQTKLSNEKSKRIPA
ncbi:HAD-IIIA family hydrolase [Pedobacter sp. SYP-B3415]|uniref:D-glycero-alpha-D-manno-heptose-1,7-bisphosphate 7-phosphatase n=1 Tax=Pedobacter sp. SYP-B3415 TaxID=2496641 RepID=UPI00101C4F6F|nr:HAD family hydrolase [Pedobacter sp. SYP-B3415]